MTDDVGISDEDRELLRRVSEEGVTSVFPPDPDVDGPEPDMDDPADGSPESVKVVPKGMSKAMVDFAITHSNSIAADEYGVSERTVERHRSYWTDGADAEAVSFENVTEVDDRLCGAMRCAARRGDTLGNIADRHGVAKATVQHHVSENTSQPCEHDVDVTVPRASLEAGGLRDGVVRAPDGTFTADG